MQVKEVISKVLKQRSGLHKFDFEVDALSR
jgi:hypothetical protein